MKKLLVLFTLCCISNINADALSDAIRASNVENVKTLLAQDTFSTKNFAKYFDTAEQVIHLKRERVISQELRPGGFSDLPESKSAGRFFMGSFLGVSTSFVGKLIEEGYTSFSYSPNTDFGRKLRSFLNEHKSASNWVLGSLAALSCFSMVHGMKKLIKAIHITTDTIRQQHRDAITIKELLYDHLATLE